MATNLEPQEYEGKETSLMKNGRMSAMMKMGMCMKMRMCMRVPLSERFSAAQGFHS